MIKTQQATAMERCIKRTRCWDEAVNDDTGCLHPPDDAVYFSKVICFERVGFSHDDQTFGSDFCLPWKANY